MSETTTETLDTKTYEWSDRIEHILDMVRLNCVHLSEYHNYKYQLYKNRLSYFRVPLIVLSAVNAYIAIGLNTYVKQSVISTTNGVISLFCGIITSIELFLNIQKRMENELLSHKQFYLLSVQIFKIISIDRSKRKMDGKTFLDNQFSEYEKLIQNSYEMDSHFKGDLLTQPDPLIYDVTNDSKPRSGSIQYIVDQLSNFYNPKIHQLRKRNKSALKKYKDVLLQDNKNDMNVTVTPEPIVEEPVSTQNVLNESALQKTCISGDPMKYYVNPFFNSRPYDSVSKEDETSAKLLTIQKQRAKIIELIEQEKDVSNNKILEGSENNV
jgi:hypothetical protein